MSAADDTDDQAARVAAWWDTLDDVDRARVFSLGPDGDLPVGLGESLEANGITVIRFGTPTLEDGLQYVQPQELKSLLNRMRQADS